MLQDLGAGSGLGWPVSGGSPEKREDRGEGGLLELGEQVDWVSGPWGFQGRSWGWGPACSAQVALLVPLPPVLSRSLYWVWGKGLPALSWPLALEGPLGRDMLPPRHPHIARCPWEQAPSCLQELDELPFLIPKRTLYKGRKQPRRPRAGSGDDRRPRGEGTGHGSRKCRQWSPPPQDPLPGA